MTKILEIIPDLPSVKTTAQKSALKQMLLLRDMLVCKAKDSRFKSAPFTHIPDIWNMLQYKNLFKDISTKKALEFFYNFPSINAALDSDLTMFLDEDKIEILKRAGKFTQDSYLKLVEKLIRILIKLIRYIKGLEMEEERAIKEIKLEEVRALKERLGVRDDTIVSTIVSNIGDISRFEDEDEGKFAGYCGLAPVVFQSGSMRYDKKRKKYNRRLKRAFFQLAFSKIRWDRGSREYYMKKREAGFSHTQALLKLARLLCKITFYELKKLKLT